MADGRKKKKPGCLIAFLVVAAIAGWFILLGPSEEAEPDEPETTGTEVSSETTEALKQNAPEPTEPQETKKSETIPPDTTTPEQERTDYISSCKPADYKAIARNPSDHKFELITFTGEVIQVSEGWLGSVILRIDTPDGIWYCTYTRADNESRILEGDTLTVYGQCEGVETYTTILNAAETIPSISIEYYDLIEDVVVKDDSGKISAGQYKIGTDLQAGTYYLIQDDTFSSYFAVTSDANGDDILVNDNFNGNSMIEVYDGEYIELSRCYALPVDCGLSFNPIDGYLGDGFYAIGEHIAPGEYKLEQDPDGYSAYYCIYDSPRQISIVTNGFIENSGYINLTAGQYLKLSGLRIKVEQ